MKSTVIIFRNLKSSISRPLIFISVFTLVSALCPLIKTGNCTGILASFLFVFYICFKVLKSSDKAVLSAFCVLSADLVYYSFVSLNFSLLFIILLSLICVKITEKFSDVNSFILLFLLFNLFSVLLGVTDKYFIVLLKTICSYVKGKGFLFGALGNFFDMAFSGRFSKYFYFKDYGGAVFKDKNIVSGAVNIFSSGVNSDSVQKYLGAKYFVNIFLTLGVFFAIFKRNDRNIKSALIAVSLTAIFAGDTRLFSLFVLLYNPLLYVSYLFVIALSYLICDMLGLRIGFINGGTIAELFKYIKSPAYFILTGLVLLFLMYFLSRFIISKYSSGENFYPENVREIIKNLGGEKNITAVKDGNVVVENPNLVNVLTLRADVRGNRVVLDDKDYDTLLKYF